MCFLHSRKVQSIKMLWIYSKAVTEEIRSKYSSFRECTGGMKLLVVLIRVCHGMCQLRLIKICFTQFIHPGSRQSLEFFQLSRVLFCKKYVGTYVF
uniref:Uncharacterized protein n=1 Tax=Pyxicephalus adspersus TaxID=30357 RepID=A0AAV3AAX3_PYXAD|nr:TPA: hypothetical protein GDO54_012033 [Pyxicephalus adspersus]